MSPLGGVGLALRDALRDLDAVRYPPHEGYAAGLHELERTQFPSGLDSRADDSPAAVLVDGGLRREKIRTNEDYTRPKKSLAPCTTAQLEIVSPKIVSGMAMPSQPKAHEKAVVSASATEKAPNHQTFFLNASALNTNSTIGNIMKVAIENCM